MTKKTNVEILMEAPAERVKYIGLKRGIKDSPSKIKKAVKDDLTEEEVGIINMTEEEFKALTTATTAPEAPAPEAPAPTEEAPKAEPETTKAKVLSVTKLPEAMKAQITFLKEPENVADLRDCPQGSIVTYPSSTKPYIRVDQNDGSHKRIVSSTQQYVMNKAWSGKLWGSTTNLNIFGEPEVKTVAAPVVEAITDEVSTETEEVTADAPDEQAAQ
jgi:hypothetical protein